MKRFFDKSVYKFLIVGSINTVLGLVLMFLFYNVFGFGYWGSSAPVYVIGSVFSYFANKRYTFSNKDRDVMSMVRFAVVQIVAYFIAYMVARPLTLAVFAWLGESFGFLSFLAPFVEQIAMIVGMGFFMVLNYCGQRFFVFRYRGDSAS